MITAAFSGGCWPRPHLTLPSSQIAAYAHDLGQWAGLQIREFLKQAGKIRELAEKYCHSDHFLFIGRKFQYPIALEGALKLKEIAYIHAEGYAAGEMKHGPIALIDPKFPTIALALEDGSYERVLSPTCRRFGRAKAKSSPSQQKAIPLAIWWMR